MNVVFLLLTTAVTAGDAPVAKPADSKPVEVKPAPTVTHAPLTSSSACAAGACGAVSDCSCDPCGKPGLFDRLRAKFRRGDDCCGEKAPRQKVCGGEGSGCFGSGAGLFSRLGRKGNDGCCGATTDACNDSCGKSGLFDRLRGKFRRGNDCCEAQPAPCCGTNGTVIAPAVKPGTVQHGAVIHGTVPSGTYATTPQIAPAQKGAPISAQPIEPRQKLPGSGVQGSPIQAPIPAPAVKPTVTTTPVLTPTAATAETSGPGL